MSNANGQSIEVSRLNSLKRAHKRKLYSTGQVAALIGVSCKTVCDWADTGKLPNVRIPSQKSDRRIYRDGLVKFMKDNGFQLPKEFRQAVLWAGRPVPNAMKEGLDHVEVLTAFDAGRAVEAYTVILCVLFVEDVGALDAREICESLVGSVPVVVVLPIDANDSGPWLIYKPRAIIPSDAEPGLLVSVVNEVLVGAES